MRRTTLSALALLGALPAAAFGKAGPAGPPATAKKPVVNEYHGVKVTDDYQWLEDWNDAAVKQWSDAQNTHARRVLDALPARAAIEKRVTEVLSNTAPSWGGLVYRSGTLFAIKRQPPKQQPFIITLKSADEPRSERVIFDPNALDKKGLTSIDFWVPSLDGKKLAVSLSQGGSEDGTLHVYDVATGKPLPDEIPGVNYGTAGGSVAWNADGTGLWYTRYPRAGERSAEDMHFYQQVWFHKLGTPVSADTYAIGKEFPRIAEVALDSTDDGKYILAEVKNGDGGEEAHYVLDTAAGKWTQVSKFEDKVVQARLGKDGGLYVLARKDAPRGKVLRLPLATPTLDKAKVVAPEGEGAVEELLPTASLLYVIDIVGGPSRFRVFDLAGQPKAPVPLPDVAGAGGLTGLEGDDVLFSVSSYLESPAWYRYTPATGKSQKTALELKANVSFADSDVVRDFCVSKDGTKVPINIVKKKGLKLDGANPTLLYGYGAYGLSMTPHFLNRRRIWIEQGGVYAEANIRGGGEYGEAWHLGGNLTNKQKDYDDFLACAQYLIDKGYTRKERLAIEGGSNGGLLMGAALTQRPDLFKAVVAHVGVFDMLRVELSPNGAFNVTEFGTVKDPAHFKAMYAYSPYHRVVDKTPYPAVLFMTGANDPRVDPANSRKMTARLQAATSGAEPILLRTSAHTGHGGGSPLAARIAEDVDAYAFLFSKLGVKYAVSGKPAILLH